MAEFKCISCGEVRESETPCTCPVCGYRMFETPYDRREVLFWEIVNFLHALEVKTVTRGDLVFLGKKKDDSRFPSYDKILKHVSEQERTEDFLRSLFETTAQMKQHFTSPFSNTYEVSFEELEYRIERYDAVLCEAARRIAPEIKTELPPAEWGNSVMLLYSRTPDPAYWAFAGELLERIEALIKKIERFIRVNNLYGDAHKYAPKKRGDTFTEATDFKAELKKAIVKTERVLAKKYVIDILDDGADELQEMLTCLWNGIELVMCAPMFLERYAYKARSEEISEADFLARLGEDLVQRYGALDRAVHVESLRDEKTEELFELYSDLIDMDTFGFLVPLGTELIRIGESEKKLAKMIGLAGVKESIKKIKAYVLSNRDSEDLNIHMCFMGNPGTGKTEVARCIAGILYENRILPTKKLVEVDRSGLVSPYFGATADKTSDVIDDAMGGVLFIDEAYALGNNADSGSTDYGREAIDTLVKAMEDGRGEFCVIFAGYKNEMQKMIATNPGFQSRIQFMLDFPNYTRGELQSIAEQMLQNRQYTVSDAAMRRMLDITDIKRKDPNFANAREIRNILDQVIMCQNLRAAGTEDKEIGIVDVNKYIKDAKIHLPTAPGGTENKVLTGEEELEQLVGLSSVKRMIRKIKAYAKRNRGEADFNLHMCFYGNPGTGKTEVARILSRILYDAGVLGEAKLVETAGQGLIGKYVGETAPKTAAKINEAMHGVLFIDEAYSLLGAGASGGAANHYGEEAIAVLLKEMEDKRGQFCTVLAGYRDEMEALLRANPGFQSRIQFTLDFPDYTREELGEIAKRFLAKKKYEIAPDALERLLDAVEHYRNSPNFANARTVRNILDQVLMNQNLRTEDFGDDNTVLLEDVEDYLADEGIDLNKPPQEKGHIGFI